MLFEAVQDTFDIFLALKGSEICALIVARMELLVLHVRKTIQ